MAGREPERTCVGCRGKAPKSALVRIVAGPEGIRIDARGGAPGRGAYVHRDARCLERAGPSGALGRALRAAIGPGEVSNLLNDLHMEDA